MIFCFHQFQREVAGSLFYSISEFPRIYEEVKLHGHFMGKRKVEEKLFLVLFFTSIKEMVPAFIKSREKWLAVCSILVD
jgi:hypothetical protein